MGVKGQVQGFRFRAHTTDVRLGRDCQPRRLPHPKSYSPTSYAFVVEVCEYTRVDDITPALPRIRNIP